MNDLFTNIKGHFKVERINIKNIVVDVYEENNLIMDSARVDVCDLVTGLSSGKNINKFILGTEGHIGDLTTPKTSATGFVSSRQSLFSEESLGVTYPISFTAADNLQANATNIIEPDSGTVVNITKSGSTVTYVIEIPITAANGPGTVAYTEAALYAGSSIFSMKTFGAKIKDETVALKITWSISF